MSDMVSNSAIRRHTLVKIEGTPYERGLRYGQRFREEIRTFLEREIYQTFGSEASQRAQMRQYAAQCMEMVRRYTPIVAEEMAGMAEGAWLEPEEPTLLALHEELYHRKALPGTPHCTAVAVGPPDTCNGHTYVGQTWDWMQSVYGLSQMLLWRREEGADVLCYSYPGLWVGAGMNEAGIALCWTSAEDREGLWSRIGVPSYALIAQMLYQNTLEEAVAVAQRAPQAGWFTFVLADGEGRLANVEGSPASLAIETTQGHLARAYYGTRQMTGVTETEPVPLHPRCQRMYELLERAAGRLNRETLQRLFGDHGEAGKERICYDAGTLDAMLFDATEKVAYVTRGPACVPCWQEFRFGD
jgi:isopenicillin-N N-acyltransferase-like protein